MQSLGVLIIGLHIAMCHRLPNIAQQSCDKDYAIEELVAELGNAFLSADLHLTVEVRDDHATYIESWLTVLKNDKRAIFRAAAHAQRAADYLHKLQEPQ